MHNKSSKNGSARFWPTPKATMPDNLKSNPQIVNGRIVRESGEDYAVNLEDAVRLDCTTISSPSTEPTTPGLTCSQGDFLANLSVSPGSEKARQMTVRSGRKCSELLTAQSPLGSLVRTLLESSRWNSTISFLTWKASATPRGRLLFRLVPSMPDTEETGFGLWPTPDTCAGGDGPSQQGRNGPRLQTVVRSCPTPKARDWKDGSSTGHNWNPNSDLGKAVLVRDDNCPEDGAKSSLPPSATPKAMDSAHADSTTPKDAASQGQLKTDTNTQSETACSTDAPKKPEHSGSLNPNWVEWLMGYPIGHTACADWVTPSSRKSLTK